MLISNYYTLQNILRSIYLLFYFLLVVLSARFEYVMSQEGEDSQVGAIIQDAVVLRSEILEIRLGCLCSHEWTDVLVMKIIFTATVSLLRGFRGGSINKALLSKCQDQSLDPQNLCKSRAIMVSTCNPSRKQEVPGQSWLPRITAADSARFQQKPCLDK